MNNNILQNRNCIEIYFIYFNFINMGDSIEELEQAIEYISKRNRKVPIHFLPNAPGPFSSVHLILAQQGKD